jgi:hypothetical protein
LQPHFWRISWIVTCCSTWYLYMSNLKLVRRILRTVSCCILSVRLLVLLIFFDCEQKRLGVQWLVVHWDFSLYKGKQPHCSTYTTFKWKFLMLVPCRGQSDISLALWLQVSLCVIWAHRWLAATEALFATTAVLGSLVTSLENSSSVLSKLYVIIYRNSCTFLLCCVSFHRQCRIKIVYTSAFAQCLGHK